MYEDQFFMSLTSLIKNVILGNRRLQPIFELLYKVSVKGMNYDRGHVPESSGEEYVMRLVKKANRGKTINIFDVGANTGQYAQSVLKIFGTTCTLYAFEPSANTFSRLIQIKAPNFYPVNAGLSAKETDEMSLYSNEPGSVWASLYKASHENYGVELNNTERISLITLDKFIKTKRIEDIALLKIDVEGHEIEVLKGAAEMLGKGKIDYIQFEFGLASIGSRIFLKDFFAILPNYRIYRILQNGLREIHYSEHSELFLTTNYLAIRQATN